MCKENAGQNRKGFIRRFGGSGVIPSRANCALGLPRSRPSIGRSLCAVSPSNPTAPSKRKRRTKPQELYPAFWRKRWDSNPRAREGYLISSQARYDHFDTLPIERNSVYFTTSHEQKQELFAVFLTGLQIRGAYGRMKKTKDVHSYETARIYHLG